MKKFKEFVAEKQNEWRYEPNKGNFRSRSGTLVGTTWYKNDTKGANIMKHNNGKFYAAGGASTAYYPNKTKLHDTPEEAAKEYHNK